MTTYQHHPFPQVHTSWAMDALEVMRHTPRLSAHQRLILATYALLGGRHAPVRWTANDLAALMGIDSSALSRHRFVLARKGLMEPADRERRTVFYRLTPLAFPSLIPSQ